MTRTRLYEILYCPQKSWLAAYALVFGALSMAVLTSYLLSVRINDLGQSENTKGMLYYWILYQRQEFTYCIFLVLILLRQLNSSSACAHVTTLKSLQLLRTTTSNLEEPLGAVNQRVEQLARRYFFAITADHPSIGREKHGMTSCAGGER